MTEDRVDLTARVEEALRNVKELISVGTDGGVRYRAKEAARAVIEAVRRAYVPFSGELHSEVSDMLADWPVADGPREQMADRITTHLISRMAPLMVESSDFDAARSKVGRLTRLLNSAESSRRDWAAEAMRLQEVIDDWQRPASWDLPHPFRDNGSGEHGVPGNCRACGMDALDELHAEPYGAPRPKPEPGAPCACISDNQASQLGPGFSRPVCTVHEEGQ